LTNYEVGNPWQEGTTLPGKRVDRIAGDASVY